MTDAIKNIANNKITDTSTFKQGVKDCLPTMLGYLSIGFAAGVVSKTAGLSIIEIAIMSILMYAGSGQFIAAGMFAVHSPIAAIVTTIFLINLRHLLMSSAIAPYFTDRGPVKNFFIGLLLTDESFAVGISHANKIKAVNYNWLVGVNVAAYSTWVTANILGGFFGEWIPSPETFGLDFALPAMFIGLLVLQVVENKKYLRDLIIIGCTAIVLVIVSFFADSSVSIIIAALVGATVGLVTEGWK